MKYRAALTTALILLPAMISAAPPVPDVPERWRTVAERSDFTVTASYDQTVEFLEHVAAASPSIRLTTFGRSSLGRPLPLVIVSAGGFFTPKAAHEAGVPVIVIQSCIHPGEVAGKSASLMILRDIALGRADGLLDAGVILFVPIYNVDGHEDVSPTNRANQHGPAGGMGFRTTVTGLDLNRDHLKLDTIEARSLVDLIDRWRPDLHIDNHVTNGSHHHWLLTWSHARAPQLAPSLDAWLDAHFPTVLTALERRGIANGPYVSLIDGTDPSKGIDSSVAGPRYSTGYFTIRNSISVLVEMYAYASFEDRVRANRVMLEELLFEIGRNPQALLEASAEARRRTVDLGRAGAEPSNIVLRWRTTTGGETVSFPVCRWRTKDSLVTGRPMILYSCGPGDPVLDVPWRHLPEAELSIPRPRGYIVMPGWHEIRHRLEDHGLITVELAEPRELEVETIRVSHPRYARKSYQGRIPVEDFEVLRRAEYRSIPTGALWIPADQPLFELAVQLLEPEAPDSLLRWGILDSVFERKEYIGLDTLEELAEKMIEDASTRQAWKIALQNEEFAGDAGARYLWWYRRTPFWDESIGLMPVFRVMRPFVSKPDEDIAR